MILEPRRDVATPNTTTYFFENTCDKPIDLILYQEPEGLYDTFHLKPNWVASSMCRGRNCQVKKVLELCLSD